MICYDQFNNWWDVLYRRSTDYGLSWEPEVRLTNDPGGSYYASICANGQVLHATWYDFRNGNGEIYYKRSLDSGLNWGADTRLTFNDSLSWASCISFTEAAVHVVWSDRRDGNEEIYYKRSTNGGTTWGPDIRLTNDYGISTSPNLAVNEGTGLFLTWFDNRDGSDEIYYKLSTDEGSSWGPDIRLTENSNESANPFIAVAGPQVNVTWYDDRDGNEEIYFKRDPEGAAMTADFSADPTGLCPGDNVLFTDLTNWNPTQWTWTFPGGSPETSTQQNPVVTYETTGNYDVSLFASNGNMSDFINRNDFIHVFTDTLATPATPTGNDILCQNPPPVQYSTTGSAGATSYLWLIDPANAGVVTGIESTVMIDWDYAFTGVALVSVKAMNICTESGFSAPLAVQINPSPVAYNLTGGGSMCEGSSGLGIGLEDSDTGVEYELFRNGSPAGSLIMGTGSAISFGTYTLPGVYTSQGRDTATLCENLMSNGVVLTVVPLPSISASPQGPDSVNSYYTPATEFITEGCPGAANYEWLLEPDDAGTTAILDTATVLVTWSPSFLGMAELFVRGVNDCGTGEWSDPLAIYVENTVGLEENTETVSVFIYPNPNAGSFSLILRNQRSGSYKISVTSILGKIIYSKAIEYRMENMIIPVHIIEYPPGIYILKVEDQTGNCLNKIIIKKD